MKILKLEKLPTENRGEAMQMWKNAQYNTLRKLLVLHNVMKCDAFCTDQLLNQWMNYAEKVLHWEVGPPPKAKVKIQNIDK